MYPIIIKKCFLTVPGYVVLIVNHEFDRGTNLKKGNDGGEYFFVDKEVNFLKQIITFVLLHHKQREKKLIDIKCE